MKNKKLKIPKKKKATINQADRVFSKYIRTKYEKNGKVKCYTCGAVMDYGKSQCGHFISRGFRALRFDENNARPQCYRCNILLKGNYIEYYYKLQKEIGKKNIEKLREYKDKFKDNRMYYVDILNDVKVMSIDEVVEYFQEKMPMR